MNDRAREAKGKSDGGSAVLEKIAEMPRKPIVCWPSGSKELTPTEEKKIKALVKKAVS